MGQPTGPDILPEQTADLGTSFTEPDRQRLRAKVVLATEAIAPNWPMRGFISRSPLLAFEHLPFEEAVTQARSLFGGRGYLANQEYRTLYARGRITEEEISRALRQVGPTVAPPTSLQVGTRRIEALEVLRLHLLYGFESINPASLEWQVKQGDGARRLRGDLPTRDRERLIAQALATHQEGLAGHQDPEAWYVASLWVSTLKALGLEGLHHREEGTETDGHPDGGSDLSGFGLTDTPSPSHLPARGLRRPVGQTLGEWVRTLSGVDVVEQINDQMIKWCAAFLDEGLATWRMPARAQGFYTAWREVAQREWTGRFLGIREFTQRVRALPSQPDDALLLALRQLGIPDHKWVEYLTRHMALLPGWAGLVRWRGENPDYAWQRRYPIRPMEYLAIRLFYEVELVTAACRQEWKMPGTYAALRALILARQTGGEAREQAQASDPDPHAHQRAHQVGADAWRLFHLAQFLGLTPGQVENLSFQDARDLLRWLDAFPLDKHGPVWLEAYEDRYRRRLLDKLSAANSAYAGNAAAASQDPAGSPARPLAQAVFCIDVRSEPLRRHLEAQGEFDTFGFAGFFGVPICYHKLDSEEDHLLCPVLIKPKHFVLELPRTEHERALRDYASGSRWHQIGHHLLHDLKANVLVSYVLIDLLGFLFGLILVGRTVLRTSYARLRAWFHHELVPSPPTRIPVEKLSQAEAEVILAHRERLLVREFLDRHSNRLYRHLAAMGPVIEHLRLAALGQGQDSEPVPGLSNEEGQALVGTLRIELGLNPRQRANELDRLSARGFTPNEQAYFLEAGLRLMGLTDHFARVVLLCGHGSTTDNNPYVAALDCGACGGKPGDPNARVLAAFANRPAVRAALRERGLTIPDDTWFLAGKHNTTTDHVSFYDVEDVPATHAADLQGLRAALDRAGAQLSLERCRRLPASPPNLSADEAARHVRERSLDWAQVRPEWGLSGNAAFIIGTRAAIKGINLEGRSFLHSYDSDRDQSGKLLETIMTAPLVVAEWINLQYFFSATDPWVYGSGSKVIHNVVGGVGLMLGSQSDLQTGLPLQTIRDNAAPFHEPMRLLAVIRAPLQRISGIIRRHQVLQQFFDHRWVQLVGWDPATGELSRYQPGGQWESLSSERGGPA